ncbi:hypothetical protein HWN40_05660 [Methanolobus zinderi]|uniref:Uncharacterized protein n=1 Tax=Methanolobus zinderi TaxID=536044 RepID=A0A7D5IPB3_9EURY|nr:hypothetical protein [Methanolobus zinderi]QLC49767.1 hypothetical protein HWN40_05660 [Methanolobus zinderi]
MQLTYKLLSITCVVFLIAFSGCMETPEASPALIDENALAAYGWSQDEEIEYNSFQQNISDSSAISFKSTVVRYKNDRLASEIEEQREEFKQAYNVPFAPEVPMTEAWIRTNRITLPGGAKIPTDLISKLRDSNVNDMSEQNDVRSFSKIDTRELAMQDGSVVSVSIYSGATGQNSSLNVLGLVTVFEDGDSSVIVMGMTPNGSLPVNIGSVEADLLSIDGNDEIEEMLELISTIE